MKPIITTLVTLTITSSLAAFATLSPAEYHDDENGKPAKSPITMNIYALDTCPVTGAKLGSMGDPAIKEYEHDGSKREVRFCCPPCVETFEKDKAKHFAEIDKNLIEQQKAHYPLESCIVSGRSLADSETVVDLIHEGRLVRFCCPGCPTRFKADPDRHLVRLDEAIIKQQRDRYPLDTCVVAGAKLGSMGEPDEVIVGGTLVRFCCAGCRGGFKNGPVKHLAKIRDAWRKQHESSTKEH